MRYHFFLYYGWFLWNLRKDFIRTNMHTTVQSKENIWLILSLPVSKWGKNHFQITFEFHRIMVFQFNYLSFKFWRAILKVWKFIEQKKLWNCIGNTGSSCLMRILLLRISLLRFFKKFHKYLPYADFGLFNFISANSQNIALMK